MILLELKQKLCKHIALDEAKQVHFVGGFFCSFFCFVCLHLKSSSSTPPLIAIGGCIGMCMQKITLTGVQFSSPICTGAVHSAFL